MIFRGITLTLTLFIGFALAFSACDNISSPEIDESVENVPNLKLINGADDATMKVNRGSSNNSYFTLELSNIESNPVINNGSMEGWCIVYDKPLDSDGGIYDGLQLYNTFGDKSFKPLNHFLNERYDLRDQHPELTWREEQVIIWSVMKDHNPFDINSMDIGDLPSRMHNDGQPLFNKDLVLQILGQLENSVDEFDYRSGQVYAIAVDNGVDDQTTIVVGETMFAYGSYEGSFNCALDMDRWGWVIEYDAENNELLYEGNQSPLNETPFVAGAGKGNENCEPYPDYNSGGMIVGKLAMDYDDGFMSFRYIADEDFLFSDPHVWVGCSMQEVKDLGGNPPANFYGLNDLMGHDLSSDEDKFQDETFIFDATNITCDGNYFISVHAGNDDPDE